MEQNTKKCLSKKFKRGAILAVLSGIAVLSYFAVLYSYDDKASTAALNVKNEAPIQKRLPVEADAVELDLYLTAEYQFSKLIDQALKLSYSDDFSIRSSGVSFQLMRYCANKKQLFVTPIPRTDLYALVKTPELTNCILEGANQPIEDDLLVALSSHPNFVKYRNNQYFGAQVDLFKKDSVITVKECMDLYRFMNQISQAEKKIEMESLMEKL